MTRERSVPILCLLLAVACLACPTARRPQPGAFGSVAVYKATYEDDQGRRRGFRLWLAAAAPDRLHAEVLPPVGGPALILDAGGGRVALSDLREGRAWVGSGESDVVERLTGIPMGIEQMVAALLGPARIEGLEVVRRPARPGLPDFLAVAGGAGRLELRLRKRQRAPRQAGSLGTGEPVAGLPVDSLRRLAEQPLPFWETTGGDPVDTPNE